uniref:DUF223 domain-containing protein n=1 Tax=Ascaris lumbricoides TaxID=6252 RepID=A0A0M3HF15_ASCLU
MGRPPRSTRSHSHSCGWHFERAPGKPHKRVLWNYEVVELFFANAKNQYLEVEVGPHGHWLCILHDLHDGFRKPFNTGENLQLEVQNTFIGVETFNAYGIHGSGENRVYKALSPVTDGTFDKPDFHRLQFFKKVEVRRIIPEGFNDTFYDLKHGDLWEGM